jgi:DNA-binding transcriptional LysR family regulator
MIDKLDFILALARERHFGRAAEACGVTQPTLSAGVKQLEEQMGVLLVNRGSRFQSFTPEGERVLDWARRIVSDTRSMREEINALRRGLSGQLRIAAIPTALPMVAALTTPYRERHPNVRFTIYSRTSIEVLDLLGNLEIDAGITYLGNEPLGHVTTVSLYQEHYTLLTSADAPLGNRDKVTWAEVSQVPLCLLTPDMQNRRIVATDVGVGFNDRAVFACTDRALGQCDAGDACRDTGPHRHHPCHPDHPARGGANHRAGRSVARADDAEHGGAGGGSTAAGAAAQREAVTVPACP